MNLSSGWPSNNQNKGDDRKSVSRGRKRVVDSNERRRKLTDQLRPNLRADHFIVRLPEETHSSHLNLVALILQTLLPRSEAEPISRWDRDSLLSEGDGSIVTNEEEGVSVGVGSHMRMRREVGVERFGEVRDVFGGRGERDVWGGEDSSGRVDGKVGNHPVNLLLEGVGVDFGDV